MSAIPRPTLNKVPGGGMPLAKRENHIKDLTKLTRSELLEIKDRECRLLANNAKLQRLPDKGQRIKNFYDKVLQELERRTNIDAVAALFSDLNIATKGEDALNQLEWNGNLDANIVEDVLDSDDETEMDPLRIIAQRSMHERRIKVLPPVASLITAEDLDAIKLFNEDSSDSELTEKSVELTTLDNKHIPVRITGSVSSESRSSTPAVLEKPPDEQDPHVRYLVDIAEYRLPKEHREKFKPYHTTISHVHDPEKEKQRQHGKHWENTAATPPFIQHTGIQMLNLIDSVEIQTNYLAKLKELQEQQAAVRLAAKLQRLENRKIQLPADAELKTNTLFTTYRNLENYIEGNLRLNETEEVHDPLDEQMPGGAVNYQVFE